MTIAESFVEGGMERRNEAFPGPRAGCEVEQGQSFVLNRGEADNWGRSVCLVGVSAARLDQFDVEEESFRRDSDLPLDLGGPPRHPEIMPNERLSSPVHEEVRDSVATRCLTLEASHAR